MSPPKFIIDLDTGIDDAMALLVALHAHKEGRICIEAITTVTGNTARENVVKNTYRLLELVNQTEIPVYLGSEEALVLPFRHGDIFHGHDGFNGLEFDSDPDVSKVNEELAAVAIGKIINQYPGEVTLVCLAPLTNIALAFKIDPSVTGKLKDMVIMGGNSEGVGNTTMAAEFNFYADPEAAFVVLNKAACPLFVVTWELCFKYVDMPMEWRQNVLGSVDTPQALLFNRLEEVWFQNWQFDPAQWILCDQFAMAVALDRRVIKAQRKKMATVELSGIHSRGSMILENRLIMERSAAFRSNVILVDKLDEEAVSQMLLDAFKHHF